MKSTRLDEIRDRVGRLVQDANFILPGEVAARLEAMAAVEESGSGKEVFREFRENADAATGLGLCQDTGLAIFFIFAPNKWIRVL